MREWMVGRRRFGIEERKNTCTKEWEVKVRDNLVTSWCTSGRTWREIEDNRVGNKKLLTSG